MAAVDRQRTRGGDALASCPDSHAEIASKVGVDKSLVTRWISGARSPTKKHVAKLAELYDIAPSAWQEAPAKRKAPKRSTDRPVAPPPSERSRPTDADFADDDPAEGNTDRLRRFIREGMRELEHDTELSGVKRAEALKKLVDAQVALDRSTGENALTMHRIAAHPEFQRVVRLITEAIAPFPEALAAVQKVLREARA